MRDRGAVVVPIARGLLGEAVAGGGFDECYGDGGADFGEFDDVLFFEVWDNVRSLCPLPSSQSLPLRRLGYENGAWKQNDEKG